MIHLQESDDLTIQRLELLKELLGSEWLGRRLKKYEQFRKRYSPSSRWSHRPLDLSPIVPLHYFARPSPRWLLDNPYGVYRGDPSGILARIMAAIVEFQDYWDSLPRDMGRRYIRSMLRSPTKFYGFRHELRLATHLTGSDYEIEPRFFDPNAEKENADIRVQDGARVFDVQCKSRNPSTSTNMPYDLFQYFAGSFARLVEDAGRSHFLYLHLKRRVDTKDVTKLLNSVRSLIKSGLVTPDWMKSSDWDIRLLEVGYGAGMTRPDDLQRLALEAQGGPLYFEIENLDPRHSGTTLTMGCHINGKRGPGLERYVFNMAEGAAKSYRGNNPLIISVNLYQETDMTEYMNSPRVGPIYIQWTHQFFSRHRNVALLIISSNYDRYFQVDEDKVALATKYLVVESQHWDGVLSNLGFV